MAALCISFLLAISIYGCAVGCVLEIFTVDQRLAAWAMGLSHRNSTVTHINLCALAGGGWKRNSPITSARTTRSSFLFAAHQTGKQCSRPAQRRCTGPGLPLGPYRENHERRADGDPAGVFRYGPIRRRIHLMNSPAYHATGRDGTRCPVIVAPARKDSGKMGMRE